MSRMMLSFLIKSPKALLLISKRQPMVFISMVKRQRIKTLLRMETFFPSLIISSTSSIIRFGHRFDLR